MKYTFGVSNPDLSRRSFIKNNAIIAAGSMLPVWLRKKPLNFSSAHNNLTVFDVLRPASQVSIQGAIGKRLDQSYQNGVFTQNVDNLIEPFRHRTETRQWQSEFWGKWFTSAIAAYKYNPQPASRKILDKAVKGLIATQTPDGYIGNYQQGHHLMQWDIWGRKYCLLGLLAYHELTGDTDSLQAAEKLTDHLIKEIEAEDGKIVNKGNYRGMPASSILGGIVQLYNATQDQKYLRFAKEIVRQWETPDGPALISKATVNVSERFASPPKENWYSYQQGQKAYEMMSCYEGLLELYRVTGEKEYLNASVRTWENILKTEINIAGSGASFEMWFGGKKRQTAPVAHYQETCVTVTWIRFCHELFRLTGEARYAEEIERSYYNALLSALSGNGTTWAKYTPLNGERLPGSGQCGMELNCCEANGPRGLFALPSMVVMSSDLGLNVNFYIPGSYQVLSPAGKRVTLIQQTDYPVTGKVHISLDMAKPEEMAISVRIPAWSQKTKLHINGSEVAASAGELAVIKRSWSGKDEITLEFDMRGRVIKQGSDRLHAAIQRGPIVLSRDSRLKGGELGLTLTPIEDNDGYVTLTPVSAEASNDIWMQFETHYMPEFYKDGPQTPKPVMVSLCDYASAGNGRVHSSYQVWTPQLFDPRVS